MTRLADPTTLRSRTITWTDPLATLDEARTMSGLRVVQGLISGELERAPISSLLDMKVTRADEGIVEMTLEPDEHFSNPMEMVHGGVVATMLDSAMGLAVHSLLQAGERYATLELKTNFLRPVAADTGHNPGRGRGPALRQDIGRG